MKQLLQISLVLATSLILITSCKKNEDNTAKPKEKAITQSEMANPDNPYDEQGKKYNEFINGITQFNGDIGGWDVGQIAAFDGDIGGWDVGQIAAFNGDIGGWDVGQIAAMSDSDGIEGWDVGQLVNLAIHYYNHKGEDTTHTREILTGILQNMGAQLGTVSIDKECWYYPENCKNKNFRNPLEILDPSNGGTSHDRIFKYIKAVKEKESGIKANKEIGESEKTVLLIAFSVARHTAAFWYNAVSQNPLYEGRTTSGENPLYNGHALQNAINMAILGAITTLEFNGIENAGVPSVILTLYILDKYGKIRR